ncbi:hypothetical protein EVAR_73016_1 [Eumeta japonica]|uniref:Uncharacterized protein n=1 Tax=Eumeta variegata TaxID=151549 RepID=A0A4C2AHL2_EUMVA|nr:hypothetical protein EVAR_73016_1 [Eumeta japonica]
MGAQQAKERGTASGASMRSARNKPLVPKDPRILGSNIFTEHSVFQMGYKTSLCQKSSGYASLGMLGDLRYFSTSSLRELLLLRVDRGSSSSDSLIIFSQTLQRPPLAVISELVLGVGATMSEAFSNINLR